MYSQDGRILLFEDNRGVYIPLNFAEEMDHSKFTGYSWQDVEELKRIGYRDYETHLPDDMQIYWETWDKILNNAEHVDEQGYVWHIEQDMDVFLVCSALEQEAKDQRKETDLQNAKDEVMDAIEGHTVFWIEENVPSSNPAWFIMEKRDGSRFYVTIRTEESEEDE